jgi:hypothetical protein
MELFFLLENDTHDWQAVCAADFKAPSKLQLLNKLIEALQRELTLAHVELERLIRDSG